MVRALATAALGIPLTLAAVLLITTAMIVGEVGVDRRVRGWMSSAGLVLAVAAVVVIAVRFLALAR